MINIIKKLSPIYINKIYLTNLSRLSDLFIYFFKKYIYTINHKRIALNYFYFSFFSMLSGVFLATLIRAELSLPGSLIFKGDSTRYIQTITSHGLIMIFYVAVPIIFGFFGNFFIPYHIGSKDVAFPRLNSIGFWLLFSGFITISKPYTVKRDFFKHYDNKLNYYNNISNLRSNSDDYTNYNIYLANAVSSNTNYTDNYLSSFFNNNFINKIKTNFMVHSSNSSITTSGWAFVAPFSAKTKYSGLGAQDVLILSVIFAGISTTITFVNLLITRRTLSSSGLRNRKVLLPFLTIYLFLTMRMLALITPVLGSAMIMLILDRHFGFSFFDYSYGGDPIMFQHLFWFFGHPEVYVVIIPGFGIISIILPYYNFRRVSSKIHLIWATYIIAYMGFLVWGHHMYLVGLDHRSRSIFSTITVMISLPAIVKIINWTATLMNCSFVYDIPMLFSFMFFFFFLSGGLTGMWLSHVSLNIYVHDTFYIVAHFHFMFSATVFTSIFAGIYYYYFQIFNVDFSRDIATQHGLYWFIGQWLTFLPIYIVGYNGCPRRYHDYPVMYSSWNSLASFGHIVTLISIFFFFFLIFDSHISKNNFVPQNMNIPRLNKRVNYYYYKIIYLQQSKKTFLHIKI